MAGQQIASKKQQRIRCLRAVNESTALCGQSLKERKKEKPYPERKDTAPHRHHLKGKKEKEKPEPEIKDTAPHRHHLKGKKKKKNWSLKEKTGAEGKKEKKRKNTSVI